MEPQIRLANNSDAPFIADCNIRMAFETEQRRLDPTTVAAGVGALLNDVNKGAYFIAQADGKPVGQMLITYEWSDWRNGWFWWVQSVYVREESRRAGVFRALFHHIQTEAEADPNVIGLRLYVERENGRAKTTYRALGMVDTPYEILEIYPLTRRTDDIG